MSLAQRRLLGAAVLLLALLAARGPLHRATHSLPLSNDDAIPLLMARHVLRGELSTILWNQPYNGALEAYVQAPGLLVAAPHTAFRAYEAACGLALVALAGLLAGRVDGEGAGWTAAALAAVGTPYMALMAATGPPPNFLVPLLVGAAVLAGLSRLEASSPPLATASVVGWGLLCGLAIWNSALAVPALAGGGLGLWAAGWRPRAKAIGIFVAGLAAGLSPLLVARVVGASGASPVTAVRPRWLLMSGLRDVGHAATGLFGLEVPLVVDGPERASLPLLLAALLGLTLVLLALAGVRSRRMLPLLGWGGAVATAFALSRRTGGDEIRYLFGLVLSVLPLAGVGLNRVRARSLFVAGALGLGLIASWIVGHRVLVAHWRDPAHAVKVWQVPSIVPALESLERARVQSAYASLQFAGRLTLDSGGRVIASQAWNERIPGDPMRFRDEVDLDPRAAWVLSPHLSRGMPRAAGFRDLLGQLGGAFHEDVAGDLHVFRAFRPPFDESQPVPVSDVSVRDLGGTALPDSIQDRDGITAWTSPQGIARGTGLVFTLNPPRRLAALVVQVGLDPTPLAAGWVCEVDGRVVAQGPRRHVLQWVNGVPRAGRQALLTVTLGDILAREVRLIFQEPGPPLTVAEVFLYGPDEVLQPARGDDAAASALDQARTGEWDEAVRLYAEAVRADPHRASRHASLARARWRAPRRRHLDVESLGDGGPELVGRR